MNNQVNKLKKRIEAIEKRNESVEADKAWETSLSRKVVIAAFTYLVLFLYFSQVLQTARPFLDAIVPTIGFLLSSWSVPFFKRFWLKYLYHA